MISCMRNMNMSRNKVGVLMQRTLPAVVITSTFVYAIIAIKKENGQFKCQLT